MPSPVVVCVACCLMMSVRSCVSWARRPRSARRWRRGRGSCSPAADGSGEHRRSLHGSSVTRSHRRASGVARFAEHRLDGTVRRAATGPTADGLRCAGRGGDHSRRWRRRRSTRRTRRPGLSPSELGMSPVRGVADLAAFGLQPHRHESLEAVARIRRSSTRSSTSSGSTSIHPSAPSCSAWTRRPNPGTESHRADLPDDARHPRRASHDYLRHAPPASTPPSTSPPASHPLTPLPPPRHRVHQVPATIDTESPTDLAVPPRARQRLHTQDPDIKRSLARAPSLRPPLHPDQHAPRSTSSSAGSPSSPPRSCSAPRTARPRTSTPTSAPGSRPGTTPQALHLDQDRRPHPPQHIPTYYIPSIHSRRTRSLPPAGECQVGLPPGDGSPTRQPERQPLLRVNRTGHRPQSNIPATLAYGITTCRSGRIVGTLLGAVPAGRLGHEDGRSPRRFTVQLLG